MKYLSNVVFMTFFSTFLFAGTPDWSFNLNDYETNSGVTAVVYIDGDVQDGSDDLLAAFGSDGSVRGVSSPAGAIPFGPYAGTNHYLITVYGNNAETGSTFTFKYYSAPNDQVVELTETIAFAPPGSIGGVTEPFLLTELLSITDELMSTDYSIHSIYPNPFNPKTNISYTLPEYSKIKIMIYDSRGNYVETLYNNFQSQGHHTILWHADKYSSGVYFVNMITDVNSYSQKMILIK